MTIDICPDYGEDINRFVEEIEQLNARIAELEAELKNARELIGMTPEPAFPAWIPVVERLPENASNVLVLSRGEQLIGSYHSEYELWYVPFVDKPVITHWMPLPEPPEVK